MIIQKISESSSEELAANLLKHVNNPYAEMAYEFLRFLLNTKRQEATSLILEAVERGVSIKDIYLYVFQESQYEIGCLWEKTNYLLRRNTTAQRRLKSLCLNCIPISLNKKIMAIRF